MKSAPILRLLLLLIPITVFAFDDIPEPKEIQLDKKVCLMDDHAKEDFGWSLCKKDSNTGIIPQTINYLTQDFRRVINSNYRAGYLPAFDIKSNFCSMVVDPNSASSPLK